jgi:hypothetical protein
MWQVITRMPDRTISAGGYSSGGGDIQSILNGSSKHNKYRIDRSVRDVP